MRNLYVGNWGQIVLQTGRQAHFLHYIHANPSIFKVSEWLFSTDRMKQVSQIDVIYCLHKVFPYKSTLIFWESLLTDENVWQRNHLNKTGEVLF